MALLNRVLLLTSRVYPKEIYVILFVRSLPPSAAIAPRGKQNHRKKGLEADTKGNAFYE